MDEIVSLVISLGMPESYGLAVDTLLSRYVRQGNYFVSQIMRRADRNQDRRTTLEELWDFDDWKFLMEVPPMFYPDFVVVNYLLGLDHDGRVISQRRDDIKKSLMEALLMLMEK